MATELTDRARRGRRGGGQGAIGFNRRRYHVREGKRSITGELLDPAAPEDMNRPTGSVIYKEDAYADEQR